MKWIAENKLLFFLALLKFILPFLLVGSEWELHRDEYLYYQQGQHLDVGFLENPPLTGVLAYVSSLFGGSEIIIKFWPALFGSVTLLIAAAITKELGGKTFAQSIAALGMIAGAWMRIHYLFQPNFLDVFCWALAIYFLIRFVNTNSNKYIYYTSLAFALGWWSKYSVVFFIAAVLCSLVFTRQRKIFTNKHSWYAFLLFLLLITPNVLWQYLHKFPLIHHMKELQETQLRYINKSEFISEQIKLLLPFLFVWGGGLIWLLSNSTWRFLGYSYLFVIIFLMLGSGKGYYTLGVYPMLLAAGGVWLERISDTTIWIRYAALTVILFLTISFIPLLLPMQSPEAMAAFNKRYSLEKFGILKWEDQRSHFLQQDFADMLGWKEVAEKAEKFYNTLPADKQASSMIYCRNYGQAGALKYYAKHPEFRNKVFCDNGTFLLWIPDDLQFSHLIFVGRRMPGSYDEVFNHFEKRTLIDSVTNPLSRQFGDKIIFFENADSSAARLAREGLNEMKREFGK